MENKEKKEVKNDLSYYIFRCAPEERKVSSPLCCKRKGDQIPVTEEEEI